jgi:hypothetical protein
MTTDVHMPSPMPWLFYIHQSTCLPYGPRMHHLLASFLAQLLALDMDIDGSVQCGFGAASSVRARQAKARAQNVNRGKPKNGMGLSVNPHASFSLKRFELYTPLA